MAKQVFVVLILLTGLLIARSSQASSAAIETQYLIVSDATGKLSNNRLKTLANQAQGALERILAFWSADPGLDKFGKIRVIFDEPRKSVYYVSVFHWGKESSRRVRFVRVFGCEGPPQEMVYKLTSAIFPHEDKLIRNMMGVVTEEQLGNQLTFPGCGFKCDTWVLAFLKTKSSIPLSRMGPDHESWGMKVAEDGLPKVFDRAKQSKTYAEAGSFGNHLIRIYGINKIKEFYDLSSRKERPWQDVYGMTLQELEENWLNSLQVDKRTRDEDVLRLAKLFEENPT